MKILLLGKNGQVGWELQRALAPLGDLVALGSKDEALCGDLSDLEGIAATVRALQPQLIVNAGAYTAVDKAEADSAAAYRVNAEAPGALAKAAQACGALLVHYSTDYVFDGSGVKPWQEGDATGPLSVYGASKLAGEQAIAQHSARHLILRTSWVYAARGGNFAKTMLRLAKEKDALNVIADQHGAPTGAELLADATAHAARQLLASEAGYGTYHLAAAGETTWHGYAQHVLQRAVQAGQTLRVAPEAAAPIPTSAYPTPAKRPLNSRLDCRQFEAAFGLSLPQWQTGVNRMLTEIL